MSTARSWRTLASLMGSCVCLQLGGCSLLWTPVEFDGGTEAPDADEPLDASNANDADLDAGVDGGMRRAERCDLEGDEDGDGLADCADPDCFGSAACCDDTVGRDLGGQFTSTPPVGWERSAATLLRTGGSGTLIDFGSSLGYLRRTACVPLAAGAVLDVGLIRQPEPGDIAFVFSPAAAAGPSGSLDEIAVRFGTRGAFTITRAGTPQPLDVPSGACSGIEHTATSYNIASPSRLVVTVNPAVADGSPALGVKVEVATACGVITATESLTIAMRDLVRTTDIGIDSCSESPGLYVAVEGHRAGFALSGGRLELSRLECASPALFSTERLPTLVREDLTSTVPSPDFAAGGIGAPDLDFEAGLARLLFDGSLEDRSSELFQPLTTNIGLSRSTDLATWSSTPSDGGPTGNLAANTVVREPTALFEGTDVVVYVRRTGNRFDLWRAGTTGGDGGSWEAAAPLLGATSSDCSFREPALTRAMSAAVWAFARCDRGTDSTLALLFDDEGSVTPGTVVQEDMLTSAPAIQRRVRAVDVVSRSHVAGRRYFAVWVLVDSATGGRELHLLAGEAAELSPPILRPYAGNPVLSDRDLQQGCAGASCLVTSFTVGLDTHPSPARLVFLFARTRTDGTGTTYEFVPRTQVAPSVLLP